jgi:YfiH family protein
VTDVAGLDRESFAVDRPGGATVHDSFTARGDGDLAVAGEAAALAERRAAIVDRRWIWLRQVHGDRVVLADVDRDDPSGVEADAAVTRRSDVALAIHTADCGPLALIGDDGSLGVVHAGWRGLEAGVIGRTVEALRERGAGSIDAVLGPCIHVECYEFGDDDLARLAAVLGPEVAGETATGRPALDVVAGVRRALADAGVDALTASPTCTACDERYFSHRARGDAGRQALVAWIEPPGPPR